MDQNLIPCFQVFFHLDSFDEREELLRKKMERFCSLQCHGEVCIFFLHTLQNIQHCDLQILVQLLPAYLSDMNIDGERCESYGSYALHFKLVALSKMF